MTVRIRVTRGSQLGTKLNTARGRLKDRKEPHEKMKSYAIDKWEDHITSNGSGTWAALSPISLRRGNHHGGQPLMHKGALFGNIRSQNAAGKVDSGYVRWRFSNRPPSYPLSHQFGINTGMPIGGGRKVPVYQPPRVIWEDWDGEDEARTLEILEAWVNQQLGGL